MLVIEHNLDVIKTADWIVDLGPEGGRGGGTVIAEGTPEQIAATADSYTGQFLAPLLDRAGAARAEPRRLAAAADCHARAPIARPSANRRHAPKKATAPRRHRRSAAKLGKAEKR